MVTIRQHFLVRLISYFQTFKCLGSTEIVLLVFIENLQPLFFSSLKKVIPSFLATLSKTCDPVKPFFFESLVVGSAPPSRKRKVVGGGWVAHYAYPFLISLELIWLHVDRGAASQCRQQKLELEIKRVSRDLVVCSALIGIHCKRIV